MELSTGRVLWEQDAFTPYPMASTTKIMTAIIALENANLSEMVTVSARAAAAQNVKMGLVRGEEIPLEGLLYALMLQSSNDAAVAIAEHVAGTVEEFCRMMTLKARELGAMDTTFITPNGLDAEGHMSTAYDLAVIARYALRNEQFVKIINTPSYITVSDKKTHSIQNKNRFLSEYEGAYGVKTGYTGGAGNCFVGAARSDGMEIVTVALGSGWGAAGKERKWIDTKNMMEYAFVNYKFESLIKKDEQAGLLTVARAKTAEIPIYFMDEVVLPVTAAEMAGMELEVTIKDGVRAPVAAGDIAGLARLLANGRQIYETSLYAGEDIPRHDLKTSAEKVLNIFASLGTNGDTEVVLPEF